MRCLLLSSLFIALTIAGNFQSTENGLQSIENNLRLIQFNESYSVWMTQEQVHLLASTSECGAGKGFMDITEFQDLGSANVIRAVPIPSGPTHQAEVKPLLPLLTSSNIGSTIAHLSSYKTRYYKDATGVQSTEWLVDQYKKLIADSGRSDITVTVFANTFIQPSYIVRIEGTAEHKDEIVVIGSHIDSISSGTTAPGADDDASGTSTVLEIFRVLVQSGFKPTRSIELHGYAAEEVGLLGSQAIASSYSKSGKNVISMLQLDMTAYVKKGTVATIGLITDYTSPELTQFVRLLIDSYVDGVTWMNDKCGYGCSDHASWNKAGYLSAFPIESKFSNSNGNIHTTNDLLANLDLNHALSYAKLGISYLVELSLL